MAEALDGALDLVPLLLWGVAWGLLSLVSLLVAVGKAHLNPSLPLGIGRPFNSAWNTVEDAVNGVLKRAADGVQSAWSGLLNGLIDSFGLLIGLSALLYLGVRAVIDKLWNDALPTLLSTTIAPVRRLALNAQTRADAALGAAVTAYDDAVSYADGVGTRTLHAARTYADSAASAVLGTAESYADEAVAKLRDAEHAAIGQAVSIAHTAEADAEAAFARAQAYAGDLVAPVGAELTDLEKYIKSLGLPALIAAVPALSLLLTQVLTETGLENGECRGKVKGICGTNPQAWEGLLFGIAAAGLELNFREFVSAAAMLAEPARALLHEVA